MTRSSTKELISPFENPEQVLRSRRKLLDNPSLVESNSQEFNQLSEIEVHIKEEVTEIMAETMKHHPILDSTNSGLKGYNSFKILFYNGLDVPTRQILDSKGTIPSKTAADAKTAIQEMAEYSQKWHNGTSSRTRCTETFDGLAAIQAQLNNIK
nr:hypothetical protein [Tanacetum cinerariifolium]